MKLAGRAADLALPVYALRRRVVLDPAFANSLLASVRERASQPG